MAIYYAIGNAYVIKGQIATIIKRNWFEFEIKGSLKLHIQLLLVVQGMYFGKKITVSNFCTLNFDLPILGIFL